MEIHPDRGLISTLVTRGAQAASQVSLTAYLAGALSLLAIYSLYNLLLHPLARLPGPLLVRLGVPSFQFMAAARAEYAWRLRDLHNRWGDVVRTGPNTVSIIDREAVHTIYAHGSDYPKTSFYTAFRPFSNKPSIFSDIDPHSHALRRRTIAPVYAMKSIAALEEYIDPCIELIQRAFDHMIEETPDKSTATLELHKWLHFFTSDTIGELAFGRSFDLLSSGKDETHFLPAVTNLSIFGHIAGTIPMLSPYIKKYLYATSLHNPSIIGETTWDHVHERLALMSTQKADASSVASRHDMLSGFIDSKYPGTNTPVEPSEVVALATSVISAGSDTTAISLAAFFYFILKHSSAYERLQVEVDNAYDAGLFRDREPVLYAQGVKLDYLQACVKEAMRLMPALAFDMPREVPSAGLLVGKKWFLPQGTEVSTNAFVFHRSVDNYGDDAEVFRPERWLDLSPSERAEMERNFFSFGAGSRVCIGRHIALMEISKLLPALLRRYNFSSTPRSPASPHKYPEGRGPDGIVSSSEPILLKANAFLQIKEFWCNISKRNNDIL